MLNHQSQIQPADRSTNHNPEYPNQFNSKILHNSRILFPIRLLLEVELIIYHHGLCFSAGFSHILIGRTMLVLICFEVNSLNNKID